MRRATPQKELARLNLHLPELRKKYHVQTLGIFGSVARGEARRNSDIDILVEFSRPIGFFAFIELEHRLSKILGKKVDLVSKPALKPIARQSILHEVVYA